MPGTGKKVASVLIETYICPSDNHGDFAPNGDALHNYAASRGPTSVYDNPACPCSHPWQGLAMAPMDDPKLFAGPFTRVGSVSELQDITDGLTNTIFFGEVRPNCSEHARNGWLASNNGNGYCTTLIPINFDTCNDSAPDPCNQSCNWNTEVGFKSLHPGGANILRGDGSVRFLAETIEHQAYQYLGAKNDGQVLQVSY
jgi:prepilin-type processing-associated H-X9-DG protein